MPCYENLTIFTKWGAEQAKISLVGTTRSVVTQLLRSDEAILYRDYGVGHFDLAVGIEHDFDFYIDADSYGGSAGGVSSYMTPWALANAVNCLEDLKTSNENFLTASIDGDNINNRYRLAIVEWKNNARCAQDTMTNLLVIDTQYWVKIRIAGNAWTCDIYSSEALRNAGGIGDIERLSCTLCSAVLTFQYLYSVMSRDRFTEWITMWQQQYDIHETVAPTVTTVSASCSDLTASLNGNITATGGTNPTERGFEWGLVSGVYPNQINESGDFGAGAYSLSDVFTDCDVTIYYRAYATNCEGTAYGAEATFICVCPEAPVVEERAAGKKIPKPWTLDYGWYFTIEQKVSFKPVSPDRSKILEVEKEIQETVSKSAEKHLELICLLNSPTHESPITDMSKYRLYAPQLRGKFTLSLDSAMSLERILGIKKILEKKEVKKIE